MAKRCRWRALAALVAAVALGGVWGVGGSAAAEPAPQLVVSTSPGGEPVGTVPLAIRAQDTSGTVTLFLAEANGQAVAGAVLYAAPPAGLSVTFGRPGGDAPAAALAVDIPKAASVDVAVTVSWTDFGSADVPLLARAGDSPSAVGVLAVTRPGGPPLTVVGAANSSLALASQGPTLATGVTIATGASHASGVIASVAPFLDTTTGTTYAVKHPQVQLGDLPADSTAVVLLDADLPYTGTFTSTLRLGHDDISDPPVDITVTRSLAPAGVTIESVTTSSSTFELWPSSSTVTRSLVLSETAGRPAKLDWPVFVKVGATVKQGAATDPNVTVTNVEVTGGSAACLVGNGAVAIGAGQSCPVDVSLRLPSSPAQYDGTLRFTQPGSQPPETTLTIQLRRGPWTAGAVILVGLAIGFFVNVFLRNRKTQLERRTGVARAGQELDGRVAALPGGLADDTERRVRDQLRSQLATLAVEVGGTGQTDTELDERLQVLRAKVAVFVPWVRLRRAVLAAPEQVRLALTTDLDEIGDQLAAAGSTKAEADALPSKVTAVQTKLRSQQAALVRNEIQRLKTDLSSLLAADARASIDPQLDRALSFVASEDGSPEQAERELAIANRQIAQALSTRLEDLLATAIPPAGMDASAWAQLQGQTRAALAGAADEDGDAAIRAIRSADSTLLRGIVDAAAAKVTELRGAIPTPPSPADSARAAAFDGIVGHLRDARTALARGDLAAAHAAYDEARGGMDTARGSGFLGTANAPSASLPALLSTAPAVGRSGAVPVPDVAVVPLPGDVRRQWQWYEVTLAIVTVAVGVLVGLLALYDGNPTWGSSGDLILAILWGAGLYQVTGAIQQGFSGVRTALAS
jgi:hypothetical protein